MNPEVENTNGVQPTENGSENVDAEKPTKKSTKPEKREFLFPV